MIDWEEASKEANREQLAALSAGNAESNEEVQRQLKEMQDKLQLEKEAKEKEIEEQMKRMEQEKQ
jgi:hypothetical protein